MSQDMNQDPNQDHSLSALAAARRQQMLPELLTAVRRRRRRRHKSRAAAVVAVVVMAVLWADPFAGQETVAPSPPATEAQASWETFRDDAALVARCRVATVTRAEWFVDDDGLQQLLTGSGRDAGLVRRGGHVQVSAAAIDPWPGRSDE